MIRDIPPPPDSNKYFQAATKLDANLRQPRSMLLAISQQVAQLPIDQSRHYMSRARTWGLAIEAVDRSIGRVDERLTTTEAFVYGSATGLTLAAQAHDGVATGTNMVHTFDSLLFAPEADEDDEDHYRHQVASELVELCGLGLMAMGNATGEVIEGWEERCVPDATKQIMFRRGVGMAAFLASRIHRQKFDVQEKTKLEQQLSQAAAGALDWDAALRNLGPT